MDDVGASYGTPTAVRQRSGLGVWHPSWLTDSDANKWTPHRIHGARDLCGILKRKHAAFPSARRVHEHRKEMRLPYQIKV